MPTLTSARARVVHGVSSRHRFLVHEQEDGEVGRRSSKGDEEKAGHLPRLQTSWLNLQALNDFFTKYPELADRHFFLSGESYAGVYIPTLAARIVDALKEGKFKNKHFRVCA